MLRNKGGKKGGIFQPGSISRAELGNENKALAGERNDLLPWLPEDGERMRGEEGEGGCDPR